MQVKVKLFATFRKGRFKEQDMFFPEETCVGRVIDELRIARKELGIVFLNGHATDSENMLQDRDTLSIFPMVGGG